MTPFPPEVVTAVLHHMNDDHTDDSLLIVRAFGAPDATGATMTGLDAEGGDWTAQVQGVPVPVRVPWPVPVVERADIRRAVVVLHDTARERLGLPPRGEH
jgi:putative heme iron utilization protein